jgi:hypothetical protein
MSAKAIVDRGLRWGIALCLAGLVGALLFRQMWLVLAFGGAGGGLWFIVLGRWQDELAARESWFREAEARGFLPPYSSGEQELGERRQASKLGRSD